MPKERSYKSNERKKANRRGLGAAFLPRPYHERTVWTPKNSLWFSGYARPEEYSLTRGSALRRRPVTHPYFKLPQPIPSPPHFTTPSTGAGRQTPATYNAPLSKELLPLPKHPPPPRPPPPPRSPPSPAAAEPPSHGGRRPPHGGGRGSPAQRRGAAASRQHHSGSSSARARRPAPSIPLRYRKAPGPAHAGITGRRGAERKSAAAVGSRPAFGRRLGGPWLLFGC